MLEEESTEVMHETVRGKNFPAGRKAIAIPTERRRNTNVRINMF